MQNMSDKFAFICKKNRLVSQQDEQLQLNYKNIPMNKPHTKILNICEITKKFKHQKQKKSSPFHNGKEQTRVNKSLMEPKQHIIK